MKNISKGKLLIILGALAVVFLIAGYGTLQATSKPEFCATCHQIKPFVDSWQQMSHKDVSCISCHADPGAVGYLKRKLEGAGELYKQATGNFDPNNLHPKVNPESCAACHNGSGKNPKAKDVVNKGAEETTTNLNFIHKRHYEQELSCIDCHKTVAHGKKPFDPSDRQVPDTKTTVCSKCHDVRTINSKGPDKRQWPFEEMCKKCHKFDPKEKPNAFSHKYIMMP
jgi:cytochrome c nitrite reductase small subunit